DFSILAEQAAQDIPVMRSFLIVSITVPLLVRNPCPYIVTAGGPIATNLSAINIKKRGLNFLSTPDIIPPETYHKK
ncbi:MAG TPA: hypothetical protein PLC28_19115, partial [Spirochaetota bacterium]|nr:hypothetical protein [Spirochaetota bacterium]HQJ72822.1 hypothetical protein [Spirochaetota bacterium]